jgi:hypothetical protein
MTTRLTKAETNIYRLNWRNSIQKHLTEKKKRDTTVQTTTNNKIHTADTNKYLTERSIPQYTEWKTGDKTRNRTDKCALIWNKRKEHQRPRQKNT